MVLFLTLIIDGKEKDKLEKIYLTYKRDMYVKAYSMLKDKGIAEDIVQNAMLIVAKHLENIQEIECNKTRSYLVIIVKNLCIDYLRKNNEVLSSKYDLLKDSIVDNEVLIDEQMIRLDMTKEMQKYLNELYPPYAEIITLRFYHGLSGREISNILGTTEVNARVRLNRALKALKESIEKRSVLYETYVYK